MKVLVGLVLAVALATPASAAADDFPCALGDGSDPTEEEVRVLDLLGTRDIGGGGGAEDIQAMLGEQAAGYWMNAGSPGVAMGVAPGALSLEEARAAIENLLTSRFGPADAALVMSLLHLHAMPYGDAKLRETAEKLEAQMDAAIGEDFGWVVVTGCLDGEAWRVEVGLFSDATPANVAAVRELLAPYGDIVRLYLDGLVTPPNASGTTEGYLRAFITLRSPKRCVRDRTIKLKTRRPARAVIRRITVTVAGKQRALNANRLTIRLKRRVTPVRVVIRVSDGSRLAHTYRFRRCAKPYLQRR